MVVTRSIRAGIALLTLSILGACAVELSENTPGAAGVCAPSAAEITDFDTNIFNAEIVAQCAACHESGTATQSAYKYQVATTITTDSARKANYCYHFRYRRDLIEFPMSPEHPARGGINVTPAMIPNLINWVNSKQP